MSYFFRYIDIFLTSGLEDNIKITEVIKAKPYTPPNVHKLKYSETFNR